MQISIELAVTIAIAVIGAVALLVRMVRAGDLKRIECAEKVLEKLPGLLQAIGGLREKVVDLEKKCDVLFRKNDDINTEFKEVNEGLADIRETIAGFGANYVTRKEYNDRDRDA